MQREEPTRRMVPLDARGRCRTRNGQAGAGCKRRRFGLALWGLCIALVASGCDEIKLPPPPASAPRKPDPENAPPLASAQQSPGNEDYLELTLLDRPFRFEVCHAALIRAGAGRPAMLKVTSYRQPAEESFPSLLLRAELPDEPVARLAGITVPAQLFVQLERDGPVWHSPHQRLLQLEIVAIDRKTVTGRIARGEIASTDGPRSSVSGGFRGTLR